MRLDDFLYGRVTIDIFQVTRSVPILLPAQDTRKYVHVIFPIIMMAILYMIKIEDDHDLSYDLTGQYIYNL